MGHWDILPAMHTAVQARVSIFYAFKAIMKFALAIIKWVAWRRGEREGKRAARGKGM